MLGMSDRNGAADDQPTGPISLSEDDRATLALLRAMLTIRALPDTAPTLVGGWQSFPDLLSAIGAVLDEMGWGDDTS